MRRGLHEEPERGGAGGAAALLCLLAIALSSCATPGEPRTRLREDEFARYYAASDGRTLRVERDGTVLDISCLPLELAEGKPLKDLPQALCPDGKIPVLGRAEKTGPDWDLSAYPIAAETGRCRPLFRLPEWDREEDARRHSCWNRLWEVPAALVAYPLGAAIIIGTGSAPVWVPLLLLL